MKKSLFKNLLTLLLFLVIGNQAATQSWDWVVRNGGSSNDLLSALVADDDGTQIVGGSFEGTIDLGGTNLEAVEDGDVFLARLSETGAIMWATSGGSNNIDITTGVALAPEGALYWTGQFWTKAYFGQDSVSAISTAKAFFLAQYSAEGDLQWLKSISGSAIKAVTDLTTTAQGDLLVTGYFQDSLLLENTALVAESDFDLFVLKYDSSGELLWSRQFGVEGRTEGRRIQVDSQGDIIIAGNLLGEVVFNEDTLRSVTTDFDIFLVKLSAEGAAQWGRIGKGVFDNLCTGLVVDENDAIYLGGTFTGVMALAGGIEISTPGFEQNIFLLRFSPSGFPDWARGLDNQIFNDPSQGTDLAYFNGQVILSGFFKGALLIDDLQLNNLDNTFNGFLASFRTDDGSVRRLRRLAATQQLLNTQVAVDSNGLISCGGNFIGEASLDDFSLLSQGQNDFFVARLDALYTPVSSLQKEQLTLHIAPNPVSNQLLIQTTAKEYVLQVFDLQGHLIFSGKDNETVDVSHFPSGLYTLLLKTNTQKITRRFIK